MTKAPAAALMTYDKVNKRKTWHKYAEAGDVYAQYELAQSYCCGVGEGERDHAQALHWWCVAAKNGHAKAQLQLGKLYEGVENLEGVTLPDDKSKALMWYELAKRRASEEARKRYFSLKNQLSKAEITRAEKKISTYKSMTCDQNS